jgi:uncharacterized protein YoxC
VNVLTSGSDMGVSLAVQLIPLLSAVVMLALIVLAIIWAVRLLRTVEHIAKTLDQLAQHSEGEASSVTPGGSRT